MGQPGYRVTTPPHLSTRVASANDYLQALARTLRLDWLDAYRQYTEGTLTLPESLALVHPECYPELQDGVDVRGDRAFSPIRNKHGLRCRSDLVWGYWCNLDTDPVLAADHLFPWSMGGPTVSTNQILLCRYHNLVKSSDVHVYPWERGEPQWLKGVLATLEQRHREFRRRAAG